MFLQSVKQESLFGMADYIWWKIMALLELSVEYQKNSEARRKDVFSMYCICYIL